MLDNWEGFWADDWNYIKLYTLEIYLKRITERRMLRLSTTSRLALCVAKYRLWWKFAFVCVCGKCMSIIKFRLLVIVCFSQHHPTQPKKIRCTAVQKKNETLLFISIQIIVEKWNCYQSSWIIVYFSLML